MSMEQECKECRFNKECVNIGQFKKGDCLQYELSINEMNRQIEEQDRQ